MSDCVTFRASDFLGFESYFNISAEKWCHSLPTVLEKIWVAMGHAPLLNKEECLWAMVSFGRPYLVYVGRVHTFISEVILSTPEIYENVRGILLSEHHTENENDRKFYETMRYLLLEAVRTRDKRSSLDLDGWKWGVGHPFWAWLHSREGFCIEFHSWIEKVLYVYRSVIAKD